MEYHTKINEIISMTSRYENKKQINFTVGHIIFDLVEQISKETGIKKSRLYQISLCLLAREFGYPLEDMDIVKTVGQHVSDMDEDPVI